MNGIMNFKWPLAYLCKNISSYTECYLGIYSNWVKNSWSLL